MIYRSQFDGRHDDGSIAPGPAHHHLALRSIEVASLDEAVAGVVEAIGGVFWMPNSWLIQPLPRTWPVPT